MVMFGGMNSRDEGAVHRSHIAAVCGFAIMSGCATVPTGPCDVGDPGREDINMLVKRIRDEHPNPWRKVSEAKFRTSARDRCDRVTGDTDAARVALIELSALVGDAHTQLDIPALALRQVPLQFEWFDDAFYVVAARDPSLVGGRLAGVGERNVDDSLAALAPVIPHSNHAGLVRFASYLLRTPVFLHARGLATSKTEATYVFELDGRRTTQTVPVGDRPPYNGYSSLVPMRFPGWKASLSTASGTPLWLRRSNVNYHLAINDGVAWVRINSAYDADDGPPFADFWADEVVPSLDGARALVVDLRGNPGGNFNHLVTSLESIAGHRLDRPDTLFVVTDHGTFSAALYAAWRLKKATKATLLGTEAADRLSSWIDADGHSLAHEKAKIYISNGRPLYGEDRHQRLLPDIRIPADYAEYRAGRDPVETWISEKLRRK